MEFCEWGESLVSLLCPSLSPFADVGGWKGRGRKKRREREEAFPSPRSRIVLSFHALLLPSFLPLLLPFRAAVTLEDVPRPPPRLRPGRRDVGGTREWNRTLSPSERSCADPLLCLFFHGTLIPFSSLSSSAKCSLNSSDPATPSTSFLLSALGISEFLFPFVSKATETGAGSTRRWHRGSELVPTNLLFGALFCFIFLGSFVPQIRRSLRRCLLLQHGESSSFHSKRKEFKVASSETTRREGEG